jgi:class 3 adenylate cyclase
MTGFDIQLEQIASGSWRVTGGTIGTGRVFRLHEHALAFARMSSNRSKSQLVDPEIEELKSKSPEDRQIRLADSRVQFARAPHCLPANILHEQSELNTQSTLARSATIAVLFIDIVGFTEFINSVSLFESIETLQSFCVVIESAVKDHNGMLEKYLGDGAMVTFGATGQGSSIALDAVRCACSLLLAVREWNIERTRANMPQLQIKIGAHYGVAALGSIGVHRIEFAVIGECVNIANRLGAMAHDPEAAIVISRSLLDRARLEASGSDPALEGFVAGGYCRVGIKGNAIAVAIHQRLFDR